MHPTLQRRKPVVHGAFSLCFEDSSVSKFSGGQLHLERIALRPFDSKPAPHINNDVGPIDAWKGHSCHGEEANIAEDEHLGDHSICLHARGQTLPKTQGATFISKKATHYHWNQYHKTTSGQQMLPRAAAAMGIMMRPWANTNSIRLGTEV